MPVELNDRIFSFITIDKSYRGGGGGGLPGGGGGGVKLAGGGVTFLTLLVAGRSSVILPETGTR